ncbi:response regulator [Nocardia sp. NPDC056064]|uniref:response regulator n=1 Tax=Nocardia sp. NPDC056064 TaxID=3345701 RepID=UPI0035DA9968
MVDDQDLVRDGIASLLDLQDGLTVVGTAADGLEAVEAVTKLAPDVVLMDVRMPRLDGVEALRRLRAAGSGCRVVMLTTFDDDEYVIAALRSGADGYLLKNLPIEDLRAAVRMAYAGVTQLDGRVTRGLSTALRPAPGTARRDLDLTPREVDIVRLIATGASNREIAANLFVSEGTVKNHISRVLSRWSLRDRTQLALAAREYGIV